MISFPDYDIGGCRLVWTACFRLVPASTTATAAPLWQLGGNGVPDPVGAPRLLPNNISPCPRIRVDAGQFAHDRSRSSGVRARRPTRCTSSA